MNLPKDFIEITNIFIPTEYNMPKNHTQDFDDSLKYVGSVSYIDKDGERIVLTYNGYVHQ